MFTCPLLLGPNQPSWLPSANRTSTSPAVRFVDPVAVRKKIFADGGFGVTVPMFSSVEVLVIVNDCVMVLARSSKPEM